ncbi:hypothetical protein ZIOFF_059586 [Zingiber officinale]|uniref:AT-rich interactive domain-containing protein 3 n=1 Tax=Zingiber officinale TaxID=94328 RepID=A0A8J5F9M3_ZINOF|nr:hypothetical protein ZIOFF_059586 [Zingiber officinale]
MWLFFRSTRSGLSLDINPTAEQGRLLSLARVLVRIEALPRHWSSSDASVTYRRTFFLNIASASPKNRRCGVSLTPTSPDCLVPPEVDLAMETDMDRDKGPQKMSNGAPLEKETDDTLMEKQTDTQMAVTMSVDSGSVNPPSEHNLAEKSDKANGLSLEEKPNGTLVDDKIDGTVLKNETYEQFHVLSSDHSTTIHPSAEHILAENSEKAHDTLLEKENDGAPLEKAIDDTFLVNQKDGVSSESFQASLENNLVTESDKIGGTPLEMQTGCAPFEMKTDLIPIRGQTDDDATMPATSMEIDSTKISATDLKAVEMKEDLAELSQNNTGPIDNDMKGPYPNDNASKTPLKEEIMGVEDSMAIEGSSTSLTIVPYFDGDESGSEEEQAAFVKELEDFYRERNMEYKPPKFYGELLNCLKLWRAVTRLGGYDQVTACKLWRQVGESFKPPKTCTTISWSFRNFYEKALLEYEKHKIQTGELKTSMINLSSFVSDDNQVGVNQASGSVRGKRDAAARAMQDKNFTPFSAKDKQGKLKKRKPSSSLEQIGRVAKTDPVKAQGDVVVADVGAPADWVKINVRRNNEFFEVYALVPGLLREEVQVQSDPAGRLIISGEPEHPDNPWGVTPFKKVITLPTRIDPYQTSAVVTLHGQLFVRAPIDLSDA